jgi:hypothetical protein
MLLLWRLVAFVLLILSLGVAVGTLWVPRPIILTVTGSPTAQDEPQRSPEHAFAGGDFVTAASDGKAYLAVTFDRPSAFRRIEHKYRQEVGPIYRVRVATIQWSDDLAAWTDAATRSHPSGHLTFDVTGAGAHQHWRLLVNESGADAKVVLSGLIFSNRLDRIPVDLAWLCVMSFAVLAFAVRRDGINWRHCFWIVSGSIGLFTLTYSLGYAPSWPVVSPDSGTYSSIVMSGQFDEYRNTGFPAFLLTVYRLFGLHALPTVQLVLVFASFAASVFLLIRGYGNAALALIFLFLLQGMAINHAFQVLTESLFMTGFVLFATGLAVAARHPSRSTLGLAGIGLLLAIAAKSIGIVLVAPALLLLRFIPPGLRLRAFSFILLPGIAVYLIMCVNSYSRTGQFSPEQYSGFALVSHIGWMLDLGPEVAPGLGEKLRDAITPILEQRPKDLAHVRSKEQLDRYVSYTINETNPIFWGKIIPITSTYFPSHSAHNSALMKIAFASIAKRPLSYAGHVAAHFYAMWLYVGHIPGIPDEVSNLRRSAAWFFDQGPDYLKWYTNYYENYAPPFFGKAEALQAASVQASIPLLSREALDGAADFIRLHSETTVVIGVLAIILSILYFLPTRFAWLYRSEIMFALTINAYFFGHTLFQVALPRYATVAAPTVMLFVFCFVLTTSRWIGAAASRAKPAPPRLS